MSDVRDRLGIESSVTKLGKITIEEISAVDQPANELDGWMIAKSRGPAGGRVFRVSVGDESEILNEGQLVSFHKAVGAAQDALTKTIQLGEMVLHTDNERDIWIAIARALMTEKERAEFDASSARNEKRKTRKNGPLVEFAKRWHRDEHGRFCSAPQSILHIGPWTCGGNVHPTLRKLAEQEAAEST